MLKSAGACTCAGLLLVLPVSLAVLAVLTILAILTILAVGKERGSQLAFAPAASQNRTAIRSETDETRLQVLSECVKKISEATSDVDIVDDACA